MHSVSIPTTPWYTHRWPWLLMLGPAVVVVAGIVTGVVAYQKQDAMVVDDYYKRGKTINLDLRRDRVATTMQLAFAGTVDGGGKVLRGSMRSFGRPYRAPFRIGMAHATIPAKDISLLVTPDAQGQFAVAIPGLEQGRWQVVIEASGREWRLTSEWRWPLQPALAIEADPANPD